MVARLRSMGGCNLFCDTEEGELAHQAADLLTSLSAELAKAREWSPNDKDDEWTAEIKAAHPSRTAEPNRWSIYDAAWEMIGNRRSKYALIDLANWLLARAERAEAERDALKARVAEVLEPFAKAAEHIVHDDRARWHPDRWSEDVKALTVGHFRKVAALHATLSGDRS